TGAAGSPTQPSCTGGKWRRRRPRCASQGGACGSAGRTTEDAAREARKPGGQRSGGGGQALTMVQNSLAVISASYSAECASSPLQGKPAACTARASTVWP